MKKKASNISKKQMEKLQNVLSEFSTDEIHAAFETIENIALFIKKHN